MKSRPADLEESEVYCRVRQFGRDKLMCKGGRSGKSSTAFRRRHHHHHHHHHRHLHRHRQHYQHHYHHDVNKCRSYLFTSSIGLVVIIIIHSFIPSFIQTISIAPLQVHFYSEALPT